MRGCLFAGEIPRSKAHIAFSSESKPKIDL